MNMKKWIDRLSERQPGILGGDRFSKYAVLLPLLEKEDGVHVLFEIRSLQLRRQPGEICFPGGRIDGTDANPSETAIRETSEELGISQETIYSVYPLDYMVSPFGTIIYPYVGIISNPEAIKPNPDEVGEIFTVPLDHFKHTKPNVYKMHFQIKPEEQFPFHLIAGGENYNWQARNMDEYFYHYEDKVIWGLTARVLFHFLEVMEKL
ncbi:NUDIX hydrolase [Peribacillus alkalitolerans]|uniref:NUDIX hydrolase n=1 Tax=Peribacillus alkalitolerans TaxID=1550385 RepID=UPI0013D1590F|nr:CoA pyrophosphatase [Peribacillus alkalitolerans]